MRSTLQAIRAEPSLELQLIVTGMHLDRRHGRSLDAIRAEGWTVDAVVPWKADRDGSSLHAAQTGLAIAKLSDAFAQLKTDIVLVVGDRVEAFAAASAGHLSRRIVAHVHGGDRAAGEIDDSLRHAITKLSHLHFPATKQSAERLRRLGEDKFRIHRVGSPGIDGIVKAAASRSELRALFPAAEPRRFVLLLLHPVEFRGDAETKRANLVLDAIRKSGIEQIVTIYPNNDPGSDQIIRVWERRRSQFTYLLKDAPRAIFLGLMRDAVMLVGNSSSGIIEAASFGTPVINIGDRQEGRERNANVVDVKYNAPAILRAIRSIACNALSSIRTRQNIYGGGDTGYHIARVLRDTPIGDRMRRKLIAY